MKRGEIRWYQFTAPDKNQPILILARDSVISYLGEITVAPVTSTVRDIPSEVLLTRADGMPKDCAVNCDHLQTVAKERIGPLITTLTPVKMTQIREALIFSLGLK